MNQLGPQDLLIGFISYFVFLFSTTCHEAAHAFVAKLGGDNTAALGGQVTLNPIPHIRRSPFGMVVVPLLGILFGNGMILGWASAPYDPLWERRHPRRAAWMALAGPATNFSLMLLAAVGIHLARSMQLFNVDPFHRSVDVIAAVLSTLFYLNLLLGTFNLLPVPPLDGSTAIMLFMNETQAQRYLDWLRGNSYAMAGLLVGMLIFYRIFPAIALFARQILL